MYNVLVTGVAGLLGGNLAYLFQKAGFQVCGVYNESTVTIPDVKMVSVANLKLCSFKPSIIIHCAAKTNVDQCEKEPDEAYQINVGLTESIIDLANKHNALLIHISTDAVYKESSLKKDENAAIEPLSVYAKTKLQAEEAVLGKASNYFVIRTNLFGFNILNKYSLAEWVHQNLSSGKTISGFFDVFFSPIFVNDLYQALLQLIHFKDKGINNVFNIGASTSLSKYEFGVQVANLFKLDQTLIKRASVTEFGFIAPRTYNTVMNSQKFEETFGLRLPSLEQSLQNFYKLFYEGYPQLLKTFNKI